MRKPLFFFPAVWAASASALAEESMPPLGDPSRIGFAMKCAGPMPSLLVKAIAAIAALTIVSVVYYKKVVEHDKK